MADIKRSDYSQALKNACKELDFDKLMSELNDFIVHHLIEDGYVITRYRHRPSGGEVYIYADRDLWDKIPLANWLIVEAVRMELTTSPTELMMPIDLCADYISTLEFEHYQALSRWIRHDYTRRYQVSIADWESNLDTVNTDYPVQICLFEHKNDDGMYYGFAGGANAVLGWVVHVDNAGVVTVKRQLMERYFDIRLNLVGIYDRFRADMLNVVAEFHD